MSTPAPPASGTITVYTTNWCPYSRFLKQDLDQAGVTYQEIDVDQDREAATFVEGVNDGDRVVPTVLFSDGSTATNPPVSQVVTQLGQLAHSA